MVHRRPVFPQDPPRVDQPDRNSIMSTTSVFADTVARTGSGAVPTPAVGHGIVARILGTIVKAREAQAQREVNRYLARQPDRLLRDMGLDDTEIAILRVYDRL